MLFSRADSLVLDASTQFFLTVSIVRFVFLKHRKFWFCRKTCQVPFLAPQAQHVARMDQALENARRTLELWQDTMTELLEHASQYEAHALTPPLARQAQPRRAARLSAQSDGHHAELHACGADRVGWGAAHCGAGSAGGGGAGQALPHALSTPAPPPCCCTITKVPIRSRIGTRTLTPPPACSKDPVLVRNRLQGRLCVVGGAPAACLPAPSVTRPPHCCLQP